MPKVYYIEPDGNVKETDVKTGTTLMQGAIDNGIDGIVAECGGACVCATCHCYIEEDWGGKIPAANDMEMMMVEGAVSPKPNSRLSCQLVITDDMDGLRVAIPESQY
ncbi:(2Fe-2S)-binding protein [Pseudomaricurvus alkylphenolicus]|uniref:2Fe-2S iron-sulfur cluster-binding protein n=1 Tax=Pseudomaricurvus alkylphenolicus TaxID=1306991 RepID=UPI00141EC2A7|nr:2Fe-2S iron-sulfur cluster-binding protein [Pseudomaricurvus alkylphenolicus]NIB38705.1 (2Fe-2S)-binding protein [Pseudomaricurvus alkylphenolicus]